MAATIFVKKILARQNYACSQARVGGGGVDRYDNLIYSGYFHKSIEISDYLFTYLLLKIYFHLKYYLKLWRLNLVSVNEDACLRSIGKSLQNRAPPYEKLLLG